MQITHDGRSPAQDIYAAAVLFLDLTKFNAAAIFYFLIKVYLNVDG